MVPEPEALETAYAQTAAGLGRPGGIDTGINPLGTDSDGQTYRNPKASYEVQKKLRRWQRAQARRQKGSRGWWEAQRKIDKCHRRVRGLRHNAQHQMTSAVTRKFSDLVIEDLNVAGLMRGNTPQSPGRRRDGRRQAADGLQGPVAPHPGGPGAHVVPQQQDLQRLRHRQRQPETGTHLDLPRLRDPARPEPERGHKPEEPDLAGGIPSPESARPRTPLFNKRLWIHGTANPVS